MTHVIVVYASKHGSTHEIADAIGAELVGAGLTADVVDAKEVRHLEADAVVIGSAVYMGRWRREAKHVLSRQAETLRAIPFWIFSTGPVGDPEAETEDAERWLEPAHIVDLATELGVRGHVVFGGSLTDAQGSMQRMMAKNMPEEFRDRRDWDEIRAWARGVATELGAPVGS
ncbi:MAG: flavodoxin [Solirubrobacteraceae bacterium]|nr:flavodoxin [Solirubrobacteraceae bacterium]